jgi:plasmid stabilization system protein ParE
MKYAVKLSRRAERDLFELFEYLHASDSAAAREWFNGLEQAIFGLEELPLRCPRAPEARRSGRPIRHLLYSQKPDVYRVLYEVRNSTKTILVLAIRHGARDEVKPRKTT